MMNAEGQIIPADKNDSEKLTALTRISKAHWGYTAEQLEKWEADLTISANYIDENSVFKFMIGEKIVAYYSLFFPEEQRIQLDNLFVLPDYIGKGIGTLLLNNAIEQSKN